jgi:uncharacterized protein (TIGR02421 family)
VTVRNGLEEHDGTAPGNGRARPLSDYEVTLRGLSDRLVEAQRPLRVLDAVQWDERVERAFFAARARELPPVTPDYYRNRPLPFDPQRKREELLGIERDVRRRLGKDDPAGRALRRMGREYRAVVSLLEQRGAPAFAALSEQLYGSAAELGPAGPLPALPRDRAGAAEPTLSAAETVQVLAARLADYFGAAHAVRVRLSDGIVADAAAGSDYIKVRRDARFTARDVRLLEVHEGWVHLGTALNGQAQPVCTFLSKGPPSSTTTQEGLAVLTEVLAHASHPGRVCRLAHRVEGIARASAGANFLEVYRFFLGAGHDERASYQHTMRIFRGSLPEGRGPFTKDLSYTKGLLLVCHFLRRAFVGGQARLVPLLFCGKTHLGDVQALAHLVDEGLVVPPRHLPPPFADLQALGAWLGRANLVGPGPICSSPGSNLCCGRRDFP